MIPITIATKLLLSILFGAAIGLEREGSQQGVGSAGGVRTYSLIALLGAICGLFYINNLQDLSILLAIIFLAMLVVYYAINSYYTKDFGMTSELAIIFTFIIGLLAVINIIPLQLVVTIFVVLVLILSLKSKIKQVVEGISNKEINSFISYAIIALVILPFLPNVGYTLAQIPFLSQIFINLNIDLGQFATLELINPHKIWIVVVLITGIDVFGYLLARIIGNKSSFALTSFVGGFISSTSTTQSLAQRSKKTIFVNYLVASAILANLASFLQIFLLVGPLNAQWLISILPSLLIMILSSAILATYFIKNKEQVKNKEKKDNRKDSIFSLAPALKFAGILIGIKLITKICLILFGNSGFVISSVIASFAGIDAIVVNLAEMAGHAISLKFALTTFLIVNATNLFSKSVYSFLQGNRKFAWKFFVAVFVVIILSFVGLLFIR